MAPIARFIVLGCSLIVAGIGAIAILAPPGEKSIEPCQDTKSETQSPGGTYKTELVVHTCAWGFGQASETVDLKVAKLGANGWFTHVPVEYDSTFEDRGTVAPTAEWTGPEKLIVTVNSKSHTGTIVSKYQALTITRTYRAQ